MRSIAYKIFSLAVLFMMVNIAVANDDVKLTASAPPSVIMGKPFQITFTANAKVTDFKAPAITNFDILAGPFKSESHSTQIINGKRGITGDSALRLAHWFGDAPEFWMTLQARCDLELAEAESGRAIRSLPTGPTVRGHKAKKPVKTA